jgi:hypothetical protein
MQEFPPNSQKARRPDDPKRVERVTSAETVRRKRGLGRQFREAFIGGSARTAAEYMITDVIVPAVRDTIAEALQSGIEKLIYGDTRPRNRSTPPTGYANVGRVNYSGMSSSSVPPRATAPAPPQLSRRSRTRHDFDELVIPSRQEANEVLDRMFDILSRYGSVPIADLYELCGLQSAHTDYKWGWKDLKGARASKLRNGGYLLNLPEPEPLDS